MLLICAKTLPHLYFTVTNDLNYDQRMIRICSTLAEAGYQVSLVGRSRKNSTPLAEQPFHQVRLNCFFEKGFLFYAAYNLRLFFFLLFRKFDGICAIDLDTILPCYFISIIRRKKRIYDAHELFCEMKEIRSRPFVYRCWKFIERMTVPHFKHGYTVNRYIAESFYKMYEVKYDTVRNIPKFTSYQQSKKGNFILYQGAVNEGRSFETLIPAMQWVNVPLWIVGNGNFYEKAKALVAEYKLADKVVFKGMVPPMELKEITPNAVMGFTLFEPDAESNYYSLANRFFDYIHAGVPQICVDYPAYRDINEQFEVAVLIKDLSPESLADTINSLLKNEQQLYNMQHACKRAAQQLNWQEESKTLLHFYKQHFG